MVSSIKGNHLVFVWPNVEVKAVFPAANGFSGGILTCWDSGLFELTNLKVWMVILRGIKSGSCLNIFIVYNFHKTHCLDTKRILWKQLANVCLSTSNSPTLLIGDFNSTRHVREIIACNISHSDSFLFSNCINQVNLIELNIINAKFTWIGPAGKKSRLDRVFSNALQNL